MIAEMLPSSALHALDDALFRQRKTIRLLTVRGRGSRRGFVPDNLPVLFGSKGGSWAAIRQPQPQKTARSCECSDQSENPATQHIVMYVNRKTESVSCTAAAPTRRDKYRFTVHRSVVPPRSDSSPRAPCLRQTDRQPPATACITTSPPPRLELSVRSDTLHRWFFTPLLRLLRLHSCTAAARFLTRN